MPDTPTPPDSGESESERPRGQLKFRDDLVPWLSKKKDQALASKESLDLLHWDRLAARLGSRSHWLAIAGVVVACVAIATVLVALIRGPSNRDSDLPEPPEPAPAIFRPDYQRLAWDVMAGFLAADSVEGKLGFVAWPERVEERMRDYYARYPDEPPSPTGFQFLSSSPSFKTENTYHLAVTLEGDSTRLWVLLDEGGALKIDWECLVAYSPIGIREFIQEPPASPVEMRVTVEASDYHNFEFTDYRKIRAYLLRTPIDPELALYGYATIGGYVHRELEAALLKAGGIVPAKLLLAPPAKAGQPSCQILWLVNPHWSGEN